MGEGQGGGVTDDEFEAFVDIGRQQRETTVRMGQEMMPVLVLLTNEGRSVNGLGGPAQMWPAMFQGVKDNLHPTEAILTSDVFLGTDMAVRPREDPAAGLALVVMSVTRGELPRYRVLPYAVNDDGTITWHEAPPTVRGIYGAVQTALQTMVNP
jgi:hypothetical protein